jgi:hypothetical protein
MKKTLRMKHWQDPVIALLGAWFAVSPWVIDLAWSSAYVAAAVSLGLLLLAFAIADMLQPQRWQHWAAAALGLITAAAPWLVGFADDAVAMRNALAVGLVASLLALWIMVREREVAVRWFDRFAH